MRSKIITLFLIGTLIYLIIYIWGIRHGTNASQCHNDTVTVERSDTIVRRDTISLKVPTLIASTVVRWDTIPKDTVLPIEHKTYKDTISCQGDTIQVESSISGIRPSLDSLTLTILGRDLIRTREVTITNTTPRKGKPFRLSPQIGMGYGVTSSKCDIYVGVGLSIDL